MLVFTFTKSDLLFICHSVLSVGFLVHAPAINDFHSLLLRFSFSLALLAGTPVFPFIRCFPATSVVLGWIAAHVLVNAFVVSRVLYANRASLISEYVREPITALFKDYPVSRQEVAHLLTDSRIIGLGKGEAISREGEGFKDTCLKLLVTGSVRTEREGKLVHLVRPGQFLNSVEWKSRFVRGLDYSEAQFSLIAAGDTTFVNLDRKVLLAARESDEKMWSILNLLLSKDIMTKLVETNYSSHLMTVKKLKDEITTYPLYRSLSVDVLNTTGKDIIETKAKIPEKSRKTEALSKLTTLTKPRASCVVYNSDTSYLIAKSIKPAMRSFFKVVPALVTQRDHFPEKDSDIIEEFEWEQSMEHCGHCEFCRPIEEAGADVDDTARHPALNL